MKADGGSYGFYFFQKQENGEWTRGAPDGLTGFTDGSDIERGWSVIDFGSITAAPYDILYKEIDPTSLKASGEDRIHLWQWSDPKYIPITFYFDR
jgi:hypothetical protein